jgi:hypothetical protein
MPSSIPRDKSLARESGGYLVQNNPRNKGLHRKLQTLFSLATPIMAKDEFSQKKSSFCESEEKRTESLESPLEMKK